MTALTQDTSKFTSSQVIDVLTFHLLFLESTGKQMLNNPSCFAAVSRGAATGDSGVSGTGTVPDRRGEHLTSRAHLHHFCSTPFQNHDILP